MLLVETFLQRERETLKQYQSPVYDIYDCRFSNSIQVLHHIQILLSVIVETTDEGPEYINKNSEALGILKFNECTHSSQPLLQVLFEKQE